MHKILQLDSLGFMGHYYSHSSLRYYSQGGGYYKEQPYLFMNFGFIIYIQQLLPKVWQVPLEVISKQTKKL